MTTQNRRATICGVSAVEVRNLHRVYRTAIGVLVRRKTKEVVAVKDISFDVHPADVEGLLAHGARGVVLSQGFQGRLQVCPRRYDCCRNVLSPSTCWTPRKPSESTTS